MAEPDLIIVSQDKPDHCHKETLCTLPADTRIKILASPAAAKKIRSWKHFTNATIESLVPYRANKKNSLVRIPIPSYSSKSAPGEITVAYMPQKMDFTAVHNAIGITYRPPGSTTIARCGSRVNLPLTPPASPPSSRTLTPGSERRVPFAFGTEPDWFQTPPDSPMDGQLPVFAPKTPDGKTLSVLYSPHGVSYSVIAPYASNHLSNEAALPLTALFHSINIEENPWFMGGKVSDGYPGGERIVRELGPQYWIGAHDEDKDNKGWSVTWIKSTAYTVEDAQRMLDEASNVNNKVAGRSKIVNMESGEALCIQWSQNGLDHP